VSIKLSDWIMQRLVREGVEHVFLVTGGGAMHLNDSVGHTPGLSYVCTLHEQAAAMAAESYTKASDRLGVCLVTTGPGGTNALTGVTGAWLDSTPMLVLSGQVKRADLKGDSGVRQLGVQEVDVVSMAAPVTKYAVTVLDPNMIRYHVEKALWLARSGRPGPVWLDIPLDVQGAIIDEATLVGFDPEQDAAHAAAADSLREAAQQTLAALSRAERPVVFVGNGVRLAGGRSVLRQLIDRLGIPVLTTWPAQDLVPDDHPLMMGRPGPVAPRGANFTIQNADFVLALGARLDLVVTGYAPQHFARAAYKVFVDIDRAEADRIAPHVAWWQMPRHSSKRCSPSSRALSRRRCSHGLSDANAGATVGLWCFRSSAIGRMASAPTYSLKPSAKRLAPTMLLYREARARELKCFSWRSS
jgi:acetolactate synthase I/II/III large subunit